MVNEKGGVEIIDFGGAIHKGLTSHTNFRGTKLYMPPEVRSGHQYRPEFADIWSLGILLFVMLYGSDPEFPICFPDDVWASDAAYDLMSWMLEENWRDRPNIEMVLEHEWLKE